MTMSQDEMKAFKRDIIRIMVIVLAPFILSMSIVLVRDHYMVNEFAKYKVNRTEYHEGMSQLMLMIEKKTIVIENLTVSNSKDIARTQEELKELITEYRLLRDETLKFMQRLEPDRARGLTYFKFKDDAIVQ